MNKGENTAARDGATAGEDVAEAKKRVCTLLVRSEGVYSKSESESTHLAIATQLQPFSGRRFRSATRYAEHRKAGDRDIPPALRTGNGHPPGSLPLLGWVGGAIRVGRTLVRVFDGRHMSRFGLSSGTLCVRGNVAGESGRRCVESGEGKRETRGEGPNAGDGGQGGERGVECWSAM